MSEASADELLRRIAELENRLAAAEQLIDRTWDYASVGTALVSFDGRFLKANSAFAEFLDRSPAAVEQLWTHQVIERDDIVRHADLLARTIARQLPSYRAETRFRRPDGTMVWGDVAVAMVLDTHGQPMHCIFQVVDITDRKKHEAELRRQALVDPLTGLANRTALLQHVEHAQQEALQMGTRVAAIMVDLEAFKPVNDRYGHAAGDDVLRATASRLRTAVRPGDVAARVGGDEFVIVCSAVDHPGAEAIVQRLRAAISEPVDLGGTRVVIGASVGLHLTEGSESAADVLAAADAAMYRDKRARAASRDVIDLRAVESRDRRS